VRAGTGEFRLSFRHENLYAASGVLGLVWGFAFRWVHWGSSPLWVWCQWGTCFPFRGFVGCQELRCFLLRHLEGGLHFGQDGEEELVEMVVVLRAVVRRVMPGEVESWDPEEPRGIHYRSWGRSA
jgi:hypothetical protein